MRSPIGEDDLQAFIDDRLCEDRRAAVESYLAAHPEVEARVALERQHRDSLRARLAEKFAEPIPARLRIANVRAAHRTAQAKTIRAAAAVALMVTSAAGGWLAHSASLAPAPAPWPTFAIARDAVAAYRTFVVEVVHPVEVGAGNEAHLVQWLSKRLGRPLQVPDLGRFGYRLMGGRLLPAGAGPAAQFMYEGGDGRRLTVYLQTGSGEQTAFRFVQEGGAATFVWLDQGIGFAVTAASNREALLPIAEAVYHTYDPAANPPGRGG